MWLLFFPVAAIAAILFFILTIRGIKKESNTIKIGTFLFSSILSVIVFIIGYLKIDVRFNPSSSEQPYQLTVNDSITLVSDFSFGDISPIYYTLDGTHVDDSDSPIKYTEPIRVQDLNVGDEVVIHAEVNFLGLYFGASDYTYTIDHAVKHIDNQDHKAYHITIDTIEVSTDNLKENDYTIPLYISLENNAGFAKSNWEVAVDKRCTFSVNEEKKYLAFNSFTDYYEINSRDNTLSTNGFGKQKTGKMLCLLVTLPTNAEPGNFYPVTYTSERSAWWSDTDTEINNDDISWTNGGIYIIE